MTRQTTTDDLDALLAALPPEIVARLRTFANRADLLEVVLDLGRRPEARFTHGEEVLLDREIVEADLAHVIEHIGAFGGDNRAGIERTLHRISAIRNRAGKVVGLTCRIGRAVFGTIDIIRDIVEGGQSVVLLGRPGIGKTTMLREVARVLADDLGKRVIVVDTSNEIAGDGDIPHPGIGDARRMQVRIPAEQHAVMIEAVENHMPEVIVIDEIGTELEAGAARTIAERGVQLIATAQGQTDGRACTTTGASGTVSCSNAMRASPIPCNRCLRSLTSMRPSNRRTCPGVVAGSARQSGSSFTTAANVSPTVAALNARLAVSISNSTMPNENTSLRRSTGLPTACSGDM